MDMASAQNNLKEAKEQREFYASVVSVFDQKVTSLENIVKGLADNSAADTAIERVLKKTPNITTKPSKLRKGRVQKPNAQIYEDIIREYGRPMHMRDLLNAALDRGIRRKNGAALDVKSLQSALSSCKRLVNLGGNRWWLAGVPAPDETPIAEREQSIMSVALLDEEDKRSIQLVV